MDWVSIVTAGACGALGGALGALLGHLFKSPVLRSAITIIAVVAAFQLGSIYATPWVEFEYLFWKPTSNLRSIIALAPDHADELKVSIRAALGRPDKQVELQKAIGAWMEKYGKRNFLGLLASRNTALADRSFNQFMAVFTAIYKHDELICYDWLSGRGTHSARELGLGDAEQRDLAALLKDARLTALPEDAPLTRQAPDPAVRASLLAKVRENWDPKQLDLDAMAQIPNHLPTARAKKACYTAYAYYSEIGKLEPRAKAGYLASMFGG